MARYFGRGLLALAGAVSGAGKAAQQSLAQGQRFLTLEAILDRRTASDMQKLALEEEYAKGREERGYTHAEKLAAAQRKHEHDVASLKATTDLTKTNLEQAGATERLKTKVGAQRDISQQEIQSRERLSKYLHETLGADVAAKIQADQANLERRLSSAEDIAQEDRVLKRFLADLEEDGLDSRQKRDIVARQAELGLANDAQMARLEKMLEAEAERQLTDIAARREEGALERHAQALLQGERLSAEHQRQLMEQEHRTTQAALDRAARAEEVRGEHDLRRTIAGWETAAQAAARQADAQKVTPVTTSDGTMVGLRADGSTVPLTDPATGKPLQGPKDVDARTRLMAETIMEMIKGNSDRIGRGDLLPKEVAAVEAQNDALMKELKVLLRFMTPPKPKPPFVWPELGAGKAAAESPPEPSEAPPAPSGILSEEGHRRLQGRRWLEREEARTPRPPSQHKGRRWLEQDPSEFHEFQIPEPPPAPPAEPGRYKSRPWLNR